MANGTSSPPSASAALSLSASTALSLSISFCLSSLRTSSGMLTELASPLAIRWTTSLSASSLLAPPAIHSWTAGSPAAAPAIILSASS